MSISLYLSELALTNNKRRDRFSSYLSERLPTGNKNQALFCVAVNTEPEVRDLPINAFFKFKLITTIPVI